MPKLFNKIQVNQENRVIYIPELNLFGENVGTWCKMLLSKEGNKHCQFESYEVDKLGDRQTDRQTDICKNMLAK